MFRMLPGSIADIGIMKSTIEDMESWVIMAEWSWIVVSNL